MTIRKLERVIPSIPASDGAGVKLRRSLGSSQLARHDPFLMLDEFFSDDPDDYLAGFPSHPHRGFETVTYMLLSLNAPAVQALPDPARAAAIARRANDFLAEEVRKRPRRFQGLAALAMQDPDGATRELVRCVKELGFRGALVNGFSQIEQRESM